MYTDAEQRVISATREGHWYKFANPETISAELVRRLMLGLPIAGQPSPVPTPCGVRIVNAVIKGALILNNGRGPEGAVLPGLVLDECDIRDGIDLSYAQLGKLSIERSVIREVRAVRAVIEGEFIANDIRPANEDDHCLISLYGARVDGDVQLRRARLRGSTQPDVFGAQRFALDLRNAEVAGNVYLRNAECLGTVNIGLATIGGNFTARAASMSPLPGDTIALQADGVIVKGAVSLRRPPGERPYHCRGQISLIRASAAALVFDGAIVEPGELDGDAINLESATIAGGIYMRDAFTLRGLLNLKRTTIQGDVSAEGATFTMGIAGPGLKADGEVDLSHAITTQALVDLRDARIGSTLKIGGIIARVDLTRARAETFDDSGDCWLEQQLILDGFVYQRLENPFRRGTEKPIWKMRLKWLSRQSLHYKYVSKLPDGLFHRLIGSPPIRVRKVSYHPQPFLHLGRVLTNMGFDNDARQVMRAKQWLEARHEKFWVRSLLTLFGIGFGFGYSSKRAIVALLLYFSVGWAGVTTARDNGWLVYDVQPVAAYTALHPGHQGYNAAVLPVTAGDYRERLPCRDIYAYSYALDLMIPLIDLHVEEKCSVRNSYKDPEKTFPAVPWMRKAVNAGAQALGVEPPPLALIDGDLNTEWPAKVAWNIAHTAYALVGWLVVSLAILTFSGLLRQKERLQA